MRGSTSKYLSRRKTTRYNDPLSSALASTMPLGSMSLADVFGTRDEPGDRKLTKGLPYEIGFDTTRYLVKAKPTCYRRGTEPYVIGYPLNRTVLGIEVSQDLFGGHVGTSHSALIYTHRLTV